MRILLATSELAPWTGGGGGVATAHLALALHAAGHDVVILTLAPGPDAAKAPAPCAPRGACAPQLASRLGPVPVVWADPRAGAAGLRAYPCRPMREAMALHLAARCLHTRTPFHVIEFPDFGGQGYFALRARDTLGDYAGAAMAIRLHTPSFVSHEVNGTRELTRARATIEHMERDALRRATLITSPSHTALDRALAGLDVTDAYLAVVPNAWSGAAESILEHADPQAPPAPEPSEVRGAEVVCVGRLEWQKGQDILARALVLLRARGAPVTAGMFGRETRLNPQGRPMRALLRTLGARDDDTPGPLSRRALRAALEHARLLAAPSRWDNMPYAVIEAMARGTPVIVSSAGGMPELVRDGIDGVVVRADTPQAWCEALATLLHDSPRQRRLASSARQRIADLCNPHRIAASWTDAVLAAAPGASPRPPRSTGAPTKDESVDVVVPHFQVPDLLQEALAALRAQTRTPTQVIIVDDGSHDEVTPVVLSRLEQAGVRVIRQSNRGPAAARLTGLIAARSRYVMFLDADERLHPTTIEKCLGALRRNPALTYVSPLVRTFDASGPRLEGWVPLGPDPDFLWALNVGGAASGTLFDRARLLALDALDPAAPGYEDWDMFCAIASRAGQGEVIPEYLLEHRLRPGSRQQRDRAMHRALVAWVRAKHASLGTPRARALASSIDAQPGAPDPQHT